MKKAVLLLALSGFFVVSFSASAALLININTADKVALMTLTGIGEVKAQAIIDYRAANGPFAAIEDIMNVSGIGTATFNNIKSSITVSGGETTADTSGQSSGTQTSTNSTSADTSSQSGTPVSSYVAPPAPTLFVDAGGDRTVIVGADTEYTGRAYNKQQEDVALVRFMWNFGDGTTAEGPSVRHHYEYPGRYAVALTIAHDKETQASRIVVTAEPARLAFSTLGDGGVSIENKAGRDLDISRWIVRSFGRMFVLPEESIILSGSSMRISNKTLNFFSGPETELDYPNGVIALAANQSTGAVVVQQQSPKQETVVPAARAVPSSAVRPVAVEAELVRENEVVPEEVVLATSTQLAAAASTGSGVGIWWVAALGFSGVIAAGAYVIRRAKRSEWDITEQ